MDIPSQVALFRLAMSEDGSRCQMVFIDQKQHVMECVADFSEFTSFISRLCEAANEMVKRQGAEPGAPDAEARTVN